MTVPLIARIGALVLATTAFYAYVGQMVPQKEVQPPQEIVVKADLTTADMVKVGREIMEGKGLCLTCHTIGKTGALRFPDLAGVDARAKSREPGLSDVEYFAQAMYEPNAFIVPGFNPGMPVINKPPIGLTDQEILCVIAYLQSLGGTPTVTLQTTHRYRGATAPPGGAPAPAATPAPGAAPGEAQPEAPPTKGTQLRPDAILQPVVAHQSTARHDGAVTR
jgi:cytochrome c5